MADEFFVTCPYCGEVIEIFIEEDVRGSFVQDCEVCCNPWRVYASEAGATTAWSMWPAPTGPSSQPKDDGVEMTKADWTGTALLVCVGVLAGAGIDWGWHRGVTTVAAQQRGSEPPATIQSLSADVAQLKLLVPSNSHIMMDVQFHWTNLWFAARRRNWPLAQYFFNESRGHIVWLIRKSPTVKDPDGKDVDIKSIFDGIDTSSLAAVKTAIEQKNSVQFAGAYKTMLESCYACHKSAGRPYLRPMIPLVQVQSLLNFDPNATWPQ